MRFRRTRALMRESIAADVLARDEARRVREEASVTLREMRVLTNELHELANEIQRVSDKGHP